MAKFLLVVSIIILSVNCWGENLMPFVLPWDDSSAGPPNVSYLLNKPAGKFGFVKVKDGHLYEGSKRLRLLGVNITTSACFPEHRDAEKTAARLAKFGINCVRFHHMDAVWANDVIFTQDKRNLDLQQLDRLDYFIFQLKKNGIYSNINLHVSRDYPDMPEWQGHPDFYKGVDIFYPPMIEKQREYARELLGHYNPYTKSKYVDEPAIAMVEINNEDGLMYMWSSDGFDNMPEPYSSSLSAIFQTWLNKRYTSDEQLNNAWKGEEGSMGSELLTNSAFTDSTRDWNLETHEQTKAAIEIANANTARVTVTVPDKTEWHVQLTHPGISVESGKYYTLSFKAKADRQLSMSAAVQLNRDPYTSLFYSKCEVDTEWKEFSYVFQSDRTDNNTRLNISGLGLQTAVWEFSQFSLREGALYKTPPAKLADVEFIKRRDINKYSPAVKQDWFEFIWDSESDYWNGMYSYLKENLKCKPLVLGTAVGFSPASMQAELDIVDSHSYWRHPEFPVRPWDGEEWIVRNDSMAGEKSGGTLGTLAAARFFGKPFTVTEYNHPAPNTYSSEAFLLLAAYAGLQDWDGIFTFAYQGSRDSWKSRKINGFFEIDQNPTKMVTMAVSALMFLRADIQPAKNAKVIQLTDQKLMETIARSGPWLGPGSFRLTGLEAMYCRIGQASEDSGMEPVVPINLPVVRSDTGQLTWDTVNKACILDSPRSKVYIGPVSDNSIKIGNTAIKVNRSKQGWAAISVTALKGKSIAESSSILITATGYSENTGMKWKSEEHTSVGSNWGNAPSLVEIIEAQFIMPSKKPIKVWTLDEYGHKMQKVSVKLSGNNAVFDIGKNAGSLWYVIER